MSRNLCMTSCHRCSADKVILDECPRPVRKADTGTHFYPEYEGMLVADATCPLCQARYLAWCTQSPAGFQWPQRTPDPGMRYFDLSYRSSFDDEPGLEDVPRPAILRQLDEALAVRNVPLTVERTVREARRVLAGCLRCEEVPER